MVLFFSYNDFNKGFLRASDRDVGEVGFLVQHPLLGGKWGGLPDVSSQQVNRWPLQAFGLVDGGEGEFWWEGGIVVGEEEFDLFVEVVHGLDLGHVEDGGDAGDLVFEDGELPGRKLARLLGEVFAEGIGEFVLGGGFELATEVDELLADVAAFDAAGDVPFKQLKGKGGEWCVLATENGVGLEGRDGVGFGGRAE